MVRGNPDIAGIDEGFSQYIRVLWNLQELPTDHAICRWNDVGIPEMCKMEWSADNSFVKPCIQGYIFKYLLQMCLSKNLLMQA